MKKQELIKCPRSSREEEECQRNDRCVIYSHVFIMVSSKSKPCLGACVLLGYRIFYSCRRGFAVTSHESVIIECVSFIPIVGLDGADFERETQPRRDDEELYEGWSRKDSSSLPLPNLNKPYYHSMY
jgi:hypothetical protein